MQSWLEGRNWVGKCEQATWMTASLRILSSKLIQTLRRATQGVNWSWSQCIKSHHAQTTSGKGLPSHFWNRNIVRSILPGLRRKRTGLLLSVTKSSFQMKVNFAFNLEIKDPESGERVERHRIQAAWSPAWSFWSQRWFGVLWRLLVLVHCVLSSPKSTQPSTRRFWSNKCFHLLTSFMEILISFSSRTLAPAHTTKTTSKSFSDHYIDWPANMHDLNPIWNLWDIFKRKMINSGSNNPDELKAQ